MATADYIRSRFERAGLKPAAPERSYFQNYKLMTATLGDGNALEVSERRRWRRGACATGQEFYPAALQRQRPRDGAGRVRRLRHHRAALAVRRLRRRRAGEDRAGARSRAGRARSGRARSTAWSPPNPPCRGARRWRRRRRARSASCSCRDVHNHPGAGELRPGGRAAYWPDAAAAPQDLHAGGVVGPDPHSRRRRFRRRWPRRWSRGTRQVARRSWRPAAEIGARHRRRVALPGVRVDLQTAVDPAHRARPQRRRPRSRAAIRS